jgi:hypothetical protein
MSNFDMRDYVPVNERISAFYEQHPDGSLQSEIVELTPDRVTVKAYAYRSDADPRPGIGHSSLTIPGGTSFTKGSEIENAETSAWGRAIAALGFEVNRGVATAEEVRNKQPSDGERADPARRGSRRPATTRPAAPRNKGEALGLLAEVMREHGLTFAHIDAKAKALGFERGEATVDDLLRLIAEIEQPGSGVPPTPVGGAEGGSVPSAPTDTPPSEGSPDSSGSDAATGPAGAASPPVQPDPAPTLDDVLAVTGGELIPPKPGTAEYRALPNGGERAKAKAWWDAHKDEQESLAAALGAPEPDR